jgi:hypothetical protein
LLVTLAACGQEQVIIQEVNDEGRSDKHYIQGSILSGSTAKDTLLYYKFDLLTDSIIFKESPELNIGISYSCINQDSSFSIGLAFNAIQNNRATDTAFIPGTPNRQYFTNVRSQNPGRRMGTSFQFVKDSHPAPVTATHLTGKEKMHEFLSLFKSELEECMKKNDTLLLTATNHLDGYFRSSSIKLIKE